MFIKGSLPAGLGRHCSKFRTCINSFNLYKYLPKSSTVTPSLWTKTPRPSSPSAGSPRHPAPLPLSRLTGPGTVSKQCRSLAGSVLRQAWRNLESRLSRQ